MRTGTHRNNYLWIIEKIRRGRREEKEGSKGAYAKGNKKENVKSRESTVSKEEQEYHRTPNRQGKQKTSMTH